MDQFQNFKQHRQRSNGFTIIPSNITRDQQLSLKGSGLLLKLLSLPPYWKFSEAGLVAIVPDGIGSVRSGLKELEKLGYIQRERVRNEKGQLKGTIWHIYEEPYFPDPQKPSYEPPIPPDFYYDWMNEE